MSLKKVLLSIALLASGLVAGLLAAEGLARLASYSICVGRSTLPFVFHPVVGWWHEANASDWHYSCRSDRSYDFLAPVRFGPEGLNDTIDGDEQRSKGGRVLFLGDSVTEALQVPREQNFIELAERRLTDEGRDVELINAGCSAFSQDNQIAWFDEYGRDLSSDLVVVVINLQNDVSENDPVLLTKTYAAAFWPPPIKMQSHVGADGALVIDRALLDAVAAEMRARGTTSLDYGSTLSVRARRFSYLMRQVNYLMPEVGMSFETLADRLAGDGSSPLLRESADAWRRELVASVPKTPVYFGVFAVPADADWERAWRVSAALIARLRDEVEASGARLLALVVPSCDAIEDRWWRYGSKRFELGPSRRFDREQPRSRMVATLEAAGIDFVDLTPALSASTEPVFFETDPHLNHHGHAVVAEAIHEALVARLAD